MVEKLGNWVLLKNGESARLWMYRSVNCKFSSEILDCTGFTIQDGLVKLKVMNKLRISYMPRFLLSYMYNIFIFDLLF